VTIKKESDEKSEEEVSSDTMSFPTGHDPDGLHYRVQGTFTRSVTRRLFLKKGARRQLLA
jgi:hypothetical protein